jgi:predicted signal transduction protein with EAL and GGDEF domain
VARRVVHAFEEPFQLEDNEIYISASIGVALYPRDVRDMNDLLKNADLAMYAAKDRGKNNYQFYTDSMNAEIVHRTTVAADLRKALEREEFVLHYQPIVRAYTREIVAVEALLRWRHPVHGMLPPKAFIEIAEETGLIVPISEAVVREACQQNKWWQDAGLPPIRMAVNVSGVQLRQQRLTDCVEVALVESGLDPSFLDLEITESAVMEDEEEASRSLGRLKDLGVRVSLDDFGTGYSSLSYVKRFPVDALKIDRSFVKDATEDSEAEAITRAIVAMAHGLRLSVVAEGVETAAQERFLEGLGCDEFQGYRYARPVLADEVALLLRDGIVVSNAAVDDTPDSPGGFPE